MVEVPDSSGSELRAELRLQMVLAARYAEAGDAYAREARHHLNAAERLHALAVEAHERAKAIQAQIGDEG